MSEAIYVGWIPRSFADKKYLLEMGVTGLIAYCHVEVAYGFGYYAHCGATDKVMQLLIKAGLPNPNSFNAVDTDTRVQLPKDKQKYWSWPTEEKNGVLYAKAECDWKEGEGLIEDVKEAIEGEFSEI